MRSKTANSEMTLPRRRGEVALLGRLIQRQIERQHVDPRLTEQAGKAAFSLRGDELPNPFFREAPRSGYPGHLKQRAFRRDIRIEATCRGGHEIGWNRDEGVVCLQ